jgi:hypothetical protein
MNAATYLRTLRFHVWAPLIAAMFVAIGLGYAGWELVQVRAEQPAIAWVERFGGQVRCDGITPTYDDETGTLIIDYDPDPTWPRSWAVQSIGSTVRTVQIKNADLNDLSPLAAFTDVEFIQLEDMRNLDLKPLAHLRRLKVLIVFNGSISDLSPLMGLGNLKVVCISETKIDKRQVKALEKALPNTAICTFGKTW